MPRLLGKRAAVRDPRVGSLRAVLLAVIAPASMNWQAHMPDGGIPMLGNDQVGDCAWASVFHWELIASGYTGVPPPHPPTAAECIAAYSAGTGYNPADPSTDQGTVIMGPGGLVEYWTRTGITIGGEKSVLDSAVTIDHTDLDDLDAALTLGPVFCGATLTKRDADSDFMWDDLSMEEIEGGHEYLIVNRDIISTGKRYYDVCTWDGMWRATDDWLIRKADEMMIPLLPEFFDKSGFNPAHIDLATVRNQMARLRVS